MLKEGLLKENIDGEALSWAARCLHMRRESRRILLVISDGAPVDQATLAANEDPRFLDCDLREVIAGSETAGAIELSAIGIKHDVRSYYAEAALIDNPEILDAALISQLGRSFQRETSRNRNPGSGTRDYDRGVSGRAWGSAERGLATRKYVQLSSINVFEDRDLSRIGS